MGRGNFHSFCSIGGEIQPSLVKQKVKNKLKRKECRSGKRTAELGALSGTMPLFVVPLRAKILCFEGPCLSRGFSVAVTPQIRCRKIQGVFLERKLALGRLGAEREFYH